MKSQLLQIRITTEFASMLQEKSKEAGFDNVSSFVRYVLRNYVVKEQ